MMLRSPLTPILRSPLSFPLNRIVSGFFPSRLFASGEQGAWYDPSDRATLFQDSAGTTPVTAVEQPVGLILDKSKGLVLGVDIFTMKSPAAYFNIGQVNAGWSTGTGSKSLDFVAVSPNSAYEVTPIGGSADRLRVQFEISGSTYVVDAEQSLDVFSWSTSRIIRTPANATKMRLYFGSASATATGLTVKELPGNHAFQTTTTSRPVLSARVNLLTATETLATQTVTTLATTQTLRFEGTGSITLSGTATGTYSAGSHSITTTAGNLTLTVSGTVTKADLRAANMGVGLPAYQQVNTSTDYDADPAKFPVYLRFDGVDDWLQTNSIDFSSTDKMTVFAGVRKLSDAAAGLVAELSVNSTGGANAGAFNLRAPEGVAATYSAWSAGTISVQAVSSATYPAPDTKVLTMVGAIGDDVAALRANGAQIASTNFNQGTGNYGNYPLYIGRRGGTTIPFNGQIYSLIVRGAQTSTTQIAQTETWVNGKTKAY